MSSEVAECKLLEEYIVAPPEEAVKNGESHAEERVIAKESGKKRGRNKKRPPPMKFARAIRLCPPFVNVSPTRETYPECTFPNCKFLHDVVQYVESKPEDLGGECYLYKTFGRCRSGVCCRFAKSHMVKDSEGRYRNKVNPEIPPKPVQETNHLKKDLQFELRRKSYNFKRSDAIVDKEFKEREAREKEKQTDNSSKNDSSTKQQKQPEGDEGPVTENGAENLNENNDKKDANEGDGNSEHDEADAKNGNNDEKGELDDNGKKNGTGEDPPAKKPKLESADAKVEKASDDVNDKTKAADEQPIPAAAAEEPVEKKTDETENASAGADGVNGEPVSKKPKIEGEEKAKNSDTDRNYEDAAPSAAKKPKLEMNQVKEETTLSESDVNCDICVAAEEKKDGIVINEDKEVHYKESKKPIDWKDKLYLAPLTTVGNLPFRRICKRFGADITCGEMAMGLPLLQGHTPEWALVQRHASEDVFGVQVCGSSPHQMSRVAQLIGDQHIDVDFVDINLGCPIDLVFNKGMGSGLMPRKKPLEVMVRAMTQILDVPLTLKMRTGVYADKRIAHTIIPKALTEWGASMVTLHGRSREQRYSRLADWRYVGECAETVPQSLPVYGNGDIVNFEDYNTYRKLAPRVSGVMIARGALIKPWVFKEIKEQKHWDISAPERLDMVRDFANYGLEHWGADDKGVETTRRFMLEWLSFLHRYVPVGMLAQPPQRMNERVPKYFKCRGDLETMLSSPKCDDWIKISEMFLGPVPDGFAFDPKHKANGYAAPTNSRS